MPDEKIDFNKLIETVNKQYKGDKTVPYLGNPQLPSGQSEFEYDKDRARIIQRCHEDIVFFAEHFFYIIAESKLEKIHLRAYQKRGLKLFQNYKKTIFNTSRQSGKSTLMTIYALWLVTFFEYKNVIIVANNARTAKEILGRIKRAYEQLPNWIKPTVGKSWGKEMVEFSNGSGLMISATSADAIRGFTVNCLSGDSVVTVKDPNNKIYSSTLEELEKDSSYNVKEVLTDNGFRPFLYSKLMGTKNIYRLETKSFKVESTDDHIYFSGDNEVKLKDLNVGDYIKTQNGNEKITNIQNLNKKVNVYDLIEVGGHRFIANGILVHNCLIFDEAAHIDEHMLQEFWSSIKPTISADPNARLLISSTPNGVGNLFFELWDKALNGENKDWGTLSVRWDEIPGRDKKWADAERRELGDERFEQEYECKFLESGGSNIPEDLYNELQSNCIKPRIELSQFDGYKIYKEPNVDERIYVAGVDIGEGVGACNSSIQILDVTDMTAIEQVATYANNTVGPNEFARQLNEIMIHWGKPPLAIERNNTGGGVVIQCMDKDYNYPCLVNFAFKQGRVEYGHLKGITSSTNTKYYGVMNMFYYLKTHRRVRLRDIDTLKELNTFVRHKNERWARKSESYKDDRVDALLWALICLHEAVAPQYFTIHMWDDNKKPFGLEPLYEPFGKKGQYRFGTAENNYGVDNIYLQFGGEYDPFMTEMNDAGWLLPEQDMERGWTSHEPSPYQFL